MGWTPVCDFENDINISLAQYEQQDSYGLKTILRPRKAALDVDESVCDDHCDDSTHDAMAELEVEHYIRKLGLPKEPERRKWAEHQTDEYMVELEISTIMRRSGIDREPAMNYKLNSKTTRRAAMTVDQFPVAGVQNLYLSPDYFKFENPYVKSPTMEEEQRSAKDNNDSEFPTKFETKSFKAPHIGVAGQQYVSPAHLYAMKARRYR